MIPSHKRSRMFRKLLFAFGIVEILYLLVVYLSSGDS